MRERAKSKFGRGADRYFSRGVAYSTIGTSFTARAHCYASIFSDAGSSAFPLDVPEAVCILNRSTSRLVLQSLNPTVNFTNGDVERVPMFPVAQADEIYATLRREFERHETTRETSVEFIRPAPSSWRHAQEWAQQAVDRSEGEPLLPYQAEEDSAAPESYISFSLGVAFGRFGALNEGLLTAPPATSLPAGILFVSTEGADCLTHPSCELLRTTWAEHKKRLTDATDLGTYLRKSFFDFHKKAYENRPIYFPLSSAKKSFVAFVSIHRWRDDTLKVLLADHLVPAKRRLEGEQEDLRSARAAGNNKGKTEKRFVEVQKLLEELNDFVAKVNEIAEKGPPTPDDKTEKREIDARHIMHIDDGVSVGSASLWPLLAPQWKEPKKWWKEVAGGVGRKDCDWSQLAARYFPTRVHKKCYDDPSLAVAHKCLWELHAAKAYAWELRLQAEIRPDFTIDEPGSNEARATFLAKHEREAREIQAKELNRREKRNTKGGDDAGRLFDDASLQDLEDADA